MAFKYTYVTMVTILLLYMVFLSAQAKKRKMDDGNAGCVSSAWHGFTAESLLQALNVKIPQPSWTETPSIVKIGSGHYRALGRVIHLKYLKEQLVSQHSLNFDALRKTMNLVKQVDILADTIYIKDAIEFYGISKLKIYAREIITRSDGNISFSTPNWNQVYKSRVVNGRNGEDGKDGIHGPQVEIFCDVISGLFHMNLNAGNGHKGQNGGDGVVARDSGHSKADKTSSSCTSQSGNNCRSVSGVDGDRGPSGGRGGNAGRPGNGGNAGRLKLLFRKINGQVNSKSCRGAGAEPARNGRGGRGGLGSNGGRGRFCKARPVIRFMFKCFDAGAGYRADRGSRGSSGASGSTPNSRGSDGSVRESLLQSGALDRASKRDFPLELINIIRRRAEDLLLGNSNDQKGKDALKFILSLANERSDMEKMKKDVKRKLGFIGKEGYDIFGKNTLFAPHIKWSALEERAENIKKAAESYEKAFNDIMSTVKGDQNFQQMASTMSRVSSLQVNAEKERLEEARRIAESEKRLYVKTIEQLENQMTSILENLLTIVPDAHDQAKFNPNDLLAVLQGLTGFSKAIATKDPFTAIESALGLAGSQSGKQCLKSLESTLDSIKTWLTFGKNYKPLVDSSSLNFDTIDVSSVPQIMQADLEMNKEKLASELVCMLDVASRPTDIADVKQHIESFIITGEARIDLIAKIMDLDNDIGGYNFDIPLLEQTEKAITDVQRSKPGAPISTKLQQTFLDNLLSTYRELERSFMRNVYELHKAFEFRTLWKENSPLTTFRRVASESARGTGRLNGAVQLTDVLQKNKEIQNKATDCFTNNLHYTTGIQKWSFNKAKNTQMFKELAQRGYTRFSLNIEKSCPECYNVRLLKIYLELLGSEDQPANVPATVHLEFRHLSASYFRAGDNTITQYRQPVGSYRNIKFDRFTISNDTKCRISKKKGQSKCSTSCVTEEDIRWHEVCTNPLNKKKCSNQDILFGIEECKSPFGIYELKIPVDKNLECDETVITNTNCKDLDFTKFTTMNVWTHFYFWSDKYPTGPNDRICRSPRNKRNETADIAVQQFPVAPDDEEQC